MPTGSLDRWPDDYDRGRPGWPPRALEHAEVSGATVLEVGAGTGKLTRLLIRRFERVLAVEPADEMRRLLVPNCPEAEVVAGSAEEIALADACVDAVFAAEAFHKFDDALAVAEFARVLRPRGTLVLMWNVPAGPTKPSIAAAEELLSARGPARSDVGYDPLDLCSTRFESGEWRRAFAGSPFGKLEGRVLHTQTVDRDGLVAFFASMGWIGDLPDADRLPLLDEMRSLLDADEYRRPWETRVYWTWLV
jgi:SAM-dependent methyltransferase